MGVFPTPSWVLPICNIEEKKPPRTTHYTPFLGTAIFGRALILPCAEGLRDLQVPCGRHSLKALCDPTSWWAHLVWSRPLSVSGAASKQQNTTKGLGCMWSHAHNYARLLYKPRGCLSHWSLSLDSPEEASGHLGNPTWRGSLGDLCELSAASGQQAIRTEKQKSGCSQSNNHKELNTVNNHRSSPAELSGENWALGSTLLSNL